MSTVDQQLKRLVDRQASKRAIRGALAGFASLDGAVRSLAAAGHSDASETIPLSTDSPYFLASITKMYTAVVVTQLVRDGSLGLDDPISGYLQPELVSGLHVIDGEDHGPAITVRQLLFQTSGLADYFGGSVRGERSLEGDLQAGRDRALTIEDVAAIVRRLEPKFPPGDERASYSDTNFALLGAVIETATGQPLPAVFAERIFAPLGLQNTFVFDHTSDRPKPATVWHDTGALDIPLAMSSFAADGGMVATLDDSLRFLQALFSPELLTQQELDMLMGRWNRIFFPLSYGGGLMRFQLPRWLSPYKNPGVLIGHSGSTGSFAFFSPAKGLLLAGTVNQSDSPRRPYALMSQMVGLSD